MRLGKISTHRGGVSEKVKVMAVIHQRVNALFVCRGQKLLVRDDGELVAVRGGRMIAHARINVRRHVHEMTSGGREFCQTRGTR